MTNETVNDQFELRALGYTGQLDRDGYVEHDQLQIPQGQKAEVTNAMVDLLTDVRLGTNTAPAYYVATFNGSRIRLVKYRQTKKELDQTLLLDGIVEGGSVIPVTGSDLSVGRAHSPAAPKLRREWGPVPPGDVLTKLPTREVLRQWPDFYINGPGCHLAAATPCVHLYNLTDSCPGCDADQEQDAPELSPEEQKMRDALELAYSTARQELNDAQRLFRSDIGLKGPVRATRLHATRAMTWETTVAVWEHAMEIGKAGSGWDRALDGAESIAFRLLRESVAPTRNAVDGALATVQGRTAESLLDTIANFRRTIR